MNIVNQKPVVLTPVYSDNIQKDYDPVGLLKQTIVEPLFTPLLPGSPVSMSANNKPITEDDITDLIVRCCGEQVDIVAEQSAKTILGQTLMTYNAKTNIGVSELFVVQSATAENLPEPDSSTVFYTPAADVIPM